MSYPTGEALPLRVADKDRCGSLKVNFSIPKKRIAPAFDEAKFLNLVFWWRKETSSSSSLLKKVMHPAYQTIMAKGPSVIPLILKEMKRRPGHWFWALEYLTDGENPAADCANLTEATRAWIGWGEANGYL